MCDFRLCPTMLNTDDTDLPDVSDVAFQKVQCMSCNSYVKVNSKQFLVNLQSQLQKVSLPNHTNTVTVTVNNSLSFLAGNLRLFVCL